MNVTVVENAPVLPNKKTLAAIRELNESRGVKCSDVDELFEKLKA